MSTPVTLFDLPFFADDLNPGERYAWGKRSHAGGIQRLGYDLGARRYDASKDRWTSVKIDGELHWANPQNANYVIYGKPVYAIAAGEVIRGWRNAPENPRPKRPEEDPDQIPFAEQAWLHPAWRNKLMPGGGNHLWIQQDDGSLVLYAHFIPGSIPATFGVSEKVLFDQPGNTSETEIPPGQRVRVESGQFLGLVGNSGNSSVAHLHINGQAGEGPLALHFRRGLATPLNDDQANLDAWESFAGQPIPPGPILLWPPRRLAQEYTRHGFPATDFQRLFDHLTDSGYALDWFDGYSVAGQAFFNFVWRPAQTAWRAFFGQTAAQYQARIDQAEADGLAPVLVESYLVDGQVRYAVIFRQVAGQWRARHGLTFAEHEAVLEQARNEGLGPVSIAVVSQDNQRFYTVLYRQRDIGEWRVRSRLDLAAYQQAVDDNVQAGRQPCYVNAYLHDGAHHFSAIFAEKPAGLFRARHDLTAEELQSVWENAVNDGLTTRLITGIDGAQARHVFAGVWRQ